MHRIPVPSAECPVLSSTESGPPWERPELLYIKFTSKDQTVILTLVLKVQLEFVGFYLIFSMILLRFVIRILLGFW